VQMGKKSRREPRVFKLLLNSLRDVFASHANTQDADSGFVPRGDRQSGNPFDTTDRAIHRAVAGLSRQRTHAY